MNLTEEEVIHQQIDLTGDELLWHGSPPRLFIPPPYFFFGLTLGVAIISGGIWRFAKLVMADDINPHYWVSKAFLFGTAGWLLSIYGVYKAIFYSNHYKTVIYGFTKKNAFWIHKNIAFKVNELPFSDIQKLDIVGRMNAPDRFTIHFSPNKQLDFWGYDYEKQVERPFPTFELVMHGDKVYEKLNEALMAYRKGVRG